jgi:WD40 repeat protein
LATTAGGQILLWDLATGQRRGQPIHGFAPQGIDLILFSRDGRRAAIPSGTSVTVVDLATGKPVGTPITGRTVRYLDDGRIAVGAGQTMQLWRPGATAPAPFATVLGDAPLPGPVFWLSPSRVYGLPAAAAASGAWALAGAAPEWNVPSGTRVGDLLGPPELSAPAAAGSESIVNPDGTLAAIGKGDTIELWHIGHRQRAALLDPRQGEPVATWDPVGHVLATTGLGGTLALWDTSDVAHITPIARATLPGYSATALPVAHFSPDGHTLAIQASTFPWSPVTLLVSARDARVLHVLTATGFSLGAVFTSDSKTVATIQDSFSGNAQVVLWDVVTGRRRSKTLRLDYPELASVSFVRGDRWLVTAQSYLLKATDRLTSRLDLWDAATLQPLGQPIMVRRDAVYVQVDQPGGSRLVSSTDTPTGTYMVWDLNPTDWASMACRIAGRNLSHSEWTQYLPGRTYQLTCTQWPAGP